MKYFLSILWTLLVAYIFYLEQPYYLPLFENLKLWIPFVLAFIFLHFLFSKIFNKRKIGTFGILILSLFFTFVLGGIKFYSYDYSRLEGVSIIQTDSGYEMISTEPGPNDKVIIANGEILTDTTTKTELYPPQVSSHFVKVKPWVLFNLEAKIVLSVVLMIIFVFLLAAFGSFTGEGFLTSTAIGLLPLSLLAFAMAELKIFSATYFAIASVIVLALTFSFWKKFLPKIKNLKIAFDWKLSLTIFFLSFDLIEITKVLPFAWDDLNVYSRYERLAAELGLFPHGIGTFAWTNIASAGWLFSHNIFFSTAMLFATSVLGFFALIKLLKRFHSTESSWIISLLFYTLPFVVNQQVIDMKTDLPLFFVSVVAVDKFLDWIEKEKRSDLIILSVLLGTAFAIKITSFLLITVIILAIIWKREKIWTSALSGFCLVVAGLGLTDHFAGLEQVPVVPISMIFLAIGLISGIYTFFKKGLKNFFTPCLIVGSISIAIVSPWLVYNYFDSKTPTISSAIYGETKIGPELNQNTLAYCKNPYEVVNLDYDRYTGGLNSVTDFLKLAWNSNFTPNFNNPVVDFSFIFLAGLGFFILFPKKLLGEKFAPIALLTGFYIILWTFTGNGVIWYGIAGFIGSLILLGQLPEKFPKKYIGILFGLVFFSNFIIRIGHFSPAVLFANNLGLISQNQLSEFIFPGYRDLAKIINQNPNMVLYRVGTFIPYFINLPDEQISNDHYLSLWICMQAESDESIKSIFKKSGITHILTLTESDPALNSADYNESHKNFINFLSRSGWKLLYNDHGLKLYEIN